MAGERNNKNVPLPKWRNWQTRQVQDLVPVKGVEVRVLSSAVTHLVTRRRPVFFEARGREHEALFSQGLGRQPNVGRGGGASDPDVGVGDLPATRPRRAGLPQPRRPQPLPAGLAHGGVGAKQLPLPFVEPVVPGDCIASRLWSTIRGAWRENGPPGSARLVRRRNLKAFSSVL